MGLTEPGEWEVQLQRLGGIREMSLLDGTYNPAVV
jgi:hypothetical protein